MILYKRPSSPYYSYDFHFEGPILHFCSWSIEMCGKRTVGAGNPALQDPYKLQSCENGAWYQGPSRDFKRPTSGLNFVEGGLA
jgi:hypothetical protein